MGARIALTLIAVVLTTAALATTASAQQVSPGGPNAQVSEYVLEETQVGGPGETPSLGGPGPTGKVGQSGELAFTGLWLLPLAALGITLVVAGAAVRRRRSAGPAIA
jgi:hypothetical protein